MLVLVTKTTVEEHGNEASNHHAGHRHDSNKSQPPLEDKGKDHADYNRRKVHD